jgi:tetratricopeptide (TPR) repeat protein
MAQHLKVMISSTARDLPEHRKDVMEACTRMEMFFSDMMENLTATDANALEVSLRMVDRADLYIGVFAYRYGYVPEGEWTSITEAEYNRAVERGIPRLIFLMSDDHPVKPSDVETGPGAEKLKALKERLEKERVVGYFDSSADLRGQVIQALVPYREADITKLHSDANVPSIAETYVAHPYTLLQTHGLIGRQEEINLLTDWVAKPSSEIYQANILNIVAVGGMGKSALTWKWFNDIAPQEMKDLAGRMWWSFYESNAIFENFVIRALAYVSHRSIDDVRKISAEERETQLLAILDREPFLIVLDGLERILTAYARMDAAHLSDDDYDKQTANFVANAAGLPASAAQSFTGEHRLRKTADPRAGAFLRKLTCVRAAKILISTRLYPADIQTGTGPPFPGCYAIFLPGLSDDDALALWRNYGVTGSREYLLPFFHRVGNHPLVIQALASEISGHHRREPGNFDSWKRDNPDFDPFSLPLVQVKSHVLEFALKGLDGRTRQVLNTIAAFRMPGQYDTLAALLIGDGKPCADERELDEVLTELEDRGLVGWDRRANRYDLHPIVRGVVWSGLGNDARQGVYTSLHAHFEAAPKVEFEEVSSLEDLTPAIELYSTLIGMGRYDDAFIVFRDRLDMATLYPLSASRQRVEMIEMLFPDGLAELPRLSDQAFTLLALALAYQFSGQPGRASPLLRRNIVIRSEEGDDKNIGNGLGNLSNLLRLTGSLRESEESARRELIIARKLKDRFDEAKSLNHFGLSLALRAISNESKLLLKRSLQIFIELNNKAAETFGYFFLAQWEIWFGEYEEAHRFANRAWELAHYMKFKRDFIRAARAQGEAALGLDGLATADERLHQALTRARAVDHVEEELPALVALAELRRRQGDEKAAREFLDDVWEFAERGPYPMFHADALNVLAQIERDAGNTDKAIEAATKAYQLAWCDGPPYAYHWGLVKAQKHLEELGAPMPDMPAFDESKYEPMPEVEIDPDDEFHVGDSL